ncbi:MAG: hypothetical protein ACR2FU_08295 [Streptosporangiaceae bacterium]
MLVADLLPGRMRLATRLPGRIEELHGPASGVVMVPRNLAMPGLRECDISKDSDRRGLYRMLLAQGARNDVARFVNAGRLGQDWPEIRKALDGRLARWCERRYGLSRADQAGPAVATTAVTEHQSG